LLYLLRLIHPTLTSIYGKKSEAASLFLSQNDTQI
jgi:hypothetical protein